MAQIFTQKKKRIEYIDLMKGFCIMLVIMLHCHITFPIEKLNIMFSYFRMPLYFFLSGLFFKEYSCFTDFFTRKFCKLVIPYLFFCIFPYIFADLLVFDHLKTRSFWLIFIDPYNGPLWFLRSLFVTYLFYYLFYKITGKNKYILGGLILLVSCTLGQLIVTGYLQPSPLHSKFFNFCFHGQIFVSILVLPFFYVAFLVKPILMKLTNGAKSYKTALIVFCISLLLWYFASTSPDFVLLKDTYCGNNYFTFLLSSLGGIGCLWAIAYMLTKLWYISYLGRYSIIALGTHYGLCVIMTDLNIEPILMFIIILILMPLFIFVFKRYFPYFTAQKDLFIYNKETKRVQLALKLKK